MTLLSEMYPSLTTFSDLDWDEITAEYESTSIEISFPEYLQKKAMEGDCPLYLHELAFYEMAAFEAKATTEPFPHRPGIYLNPTALFLSLEFDVVRMLEEAKLGKVEIYERPHFLCLYKDLEGEVNSVELDEPSLGLLQVLEDGPKPGQQFVPLPLAEVFQDLVAKGLILNLV